MDNNSPPPPPQPTQEQDVPSGSPPPYEAPSNAPTENFHMEAPPLYTEVVKLPAYHETENEEPENRSIFLYWLQNNEVNNGEEIVGSDLGFILCFLLAFIFNWVGFFAGYCFTNSLSAHFGAISGFGLSLVKWAFIVRHTEWSKEYFDESPWLIYLFVLCGWLIFLRGMFSYAQLKRHVYSRLREDDEESAPQQLLY